MMWEHQPKLLVIYSVLYIVLNKNGMLTFAPTWDLIREALNSPLLVKYLHHVVDLLPALKGGGFLL